MSKHTINLERLMTTINESHKIGQSGTGLHRLALSDEDKRMRDVFIKWLEEENLDVRVDDFGNIYGRRDGRRNELPPVMVGSHLDTQPHGGRFDGILGVLSALEVVRVLNEKDIRTLRPIEVVNFTNEEGARFVPPMLGSGGITNVFSKDDVYNCTDDDGIRFEDELKRIGYLGDEEHRPKDIHSFIEFHIEQGPILEQRGIEIGVVEGVKGITWLEFKVKGDADHAGPTPMAGRKDALLKACDIIVLLKEIVTDFDDEGTVTVGKIHAAPGSINIIPGEVTFTVDIRHRNDTARRRLIETMKEKAAELAVNDGMTVDIRTLLESPAVQFSDQVKNAIEEAARQFGYSTMKLMSGAGHDAKYMQNIAPTAMIFVPSRGGISHNVKEYTAEEAIEKGANVLLNAVLTLAQQDEAPASGHSR